MSQDNFKKEIMKKRCIVCYFEFFTHYTDRIVCPSCNLQNDSTKTVRSWEN